jgi:phosphotransferase system HPr (HPr) family protein
LTKEVCEIQVEIKNADGLHMRPAMQVVDIASRFQSDIKIKNDKTQVNAKSIMQVTMLAATCGTKLSIRAEGADAKQAAEELRKLIEERMFDEPPPKGK